MKESHCPTPGQAATIPAWRHQGWGLNQPLPAPLQLQADPLSER